MRYNIQLPSYEFVAHKLKMEVIYYDVVPQSYDVVVRRFNLLVRQEEIAISQKYVFPNPCSLMVCSCSNANAPPLSPYKLYPGFEFLQSKFLWVGRINQQLIEHLLFWIDILTDQDCYK